MSEETYALGAHTFRSRLIIGSGKYESFEQNLVCAEESGAEMVTVALRRTALDAPKGEGLLDFISPDRFAILPNTAGCFNLEDALTTARMGRELLGTDLVKLEAVAEKLDRAGSQPQEPLHTRHHQPAASEIRREPGNAQTGFPLITQGALEIEAAAERPFLHKLAYLLIQDRGELSSRLELEDGKINIQGALLQDGNSPRQPATRLHPRGSLDPKSGGGEKHACFRRAQRQVQVLRHQRQPASFVGIAHPQTAQPEGRQTRRGAAGPGGRLRPRTRRWVLPQQL